MLYNLMFSEREVQRLMLVLEAARDMRIIRPQEVEQMLKYIYDEVEVQDRVLNPVRDGKDGKYIFESMKIRLENGVSHKNYD